MSLIQDETAGTKIYAVAYNYLGDLTRLADELGAEISENLLIFSNLDGKRFLTCWRDAELTTIMATRLTSHNGTAIDHCPKYPRREKKG